MMRRLTLPALLLALAPAAAQTPDQQYELCVKQFNEFRDRFNGRYAGAVPEGVAAPDRRTLLHSLMASTLDEGTREAFVNDVLARGAASELELDGTPWLAHVVCHTWSSGDTAAVGFWLVREQVGAARKWSILGTDLARVAPGTQLYIDSKSHEYGFIDLLRIDDEGRPGVYPYIGPPGISALFELQEALLRGGLRILAIERVTMHLLQVPGWTLQVEYRPPPLRARDFTPSGWNVVRAERMSDGDKLQYLWKHVLGL
ncbi:MAG: hypothetical protein IPJ87_13575 [Flavobacteriales bacterium]|jgi:hypothetical protein|nr:hypothetical protein [Flavobacteriales bacterium]MBK7942880.1 hypothetical protein [Flavobacteriales bacterium]MBK8948939.1 hypothetical protein [Flavobacteriales bacterium]MBK9698719.1 hypothetical protein [Flavobacteriales bacterium]